MSGDNRWSLYLPYLGLFRFHRAEVQRTAKGARGSSVVECQYLVLFKLLH